MSPPRFVTSMALLLLLGAPTALAAPAGVGKAAMTVPRNIQVSVGRGHAWGSLRATVAPARYDLPDWAGFDRNTDGRLAPDEVALLVEFVAQRESEYVGISVHGELLRFAAWKGKRIAEPGAEQSLAGPISVRVEGRVPLELSGDVHRFVLYDKPATPDGFVPVRFSLAPGMAFVEAQGGRGEMVTPRRLEAAMTWLAPVVWGTFGPEPAK